MEDPATGDLLCDVADATVEDAQAALGAYGAFEDFRNYSPRSAVRSYASDELIMSASTILRC